MFNANLRGLQHDLWTSTHTSRECARRHTARDADLGLTSSLRSANRRTTLEEHTDRGGCEEERRYCFLRILRDKFDGIFQHSLSKGSLNVKYQG